ncbi:MAG: 1-deoxy-D-xylulose-5-phosphate reductoisomerase, partial [Defluviitaleaceae bacterium]|nr:1-deoxy-D-xylulose-5-phosphate reductoisomerase [Defluviitaleaceae bacterium]
MTISILGSTGSIGTQTLEVAQQLNIKIAALTAHSNIDLLESQIRNFKPSLVVVYDEGKALELKNRIGGIVEISTGIEGLKQAASMGEASVIVNALVGNIGLTPTVAAIKAGKIIALANKEVLVAAGSIIMPLSRQYNAPIVPVDSEHSAILQCLKGEAAPSKIYLTASGGPFRGKTKAEMKNITVDEALKHPNWSMGKKIYIDSETMMNKGLEVI